MKVKALKRFFLHASSDIGTISTEMYKTHVKKHIFCGQAKVAKLLFFNECNELLVIR
jgi:hypothetical protein